MSHSSMNTLKFCFYMVCKYLFTECKYLCNFVDFYQSTFINSIALICQFKNKKITCTDLLIFTSQGFTIHSNRVAEWIVNPWLAKMCFTYLQVQLRNHTSTCIRNFKFHIYLVFVLNAI